MLFGIFRHIETNKFDAHFAGQGACHFGLAHACRSHKEQRGDGLFVVGEPCLGHHDGFHHLFHGFVLTVDLRQNAVFQTFESGVLFVAEGFGVYLAHLCEHLAYELAGYRWHDAVILWRVAFEVGTGFVYQVDGLVGQKPVGDVFGTCPYSIVDSVVVILYVVEFGIVGQDAFDDGEGFVDARFGHVYLLEAP